MSPKNFDHAEAEVHDITLASMCWRIYLLSKMIQGGAIIQTDIMLIQGRLLSLPPLTSPTFVSSMRSFEISPQSVICHMYSHHPVYLHQA